MKQERTFAKTALFLVCYLITGGWLTVAQAHPSGLDVLDTNPGVRTPITHGFWFPKLVTMGEEWYRGRLIELGSHNETGNLPDDTDDDGHRGFTAKNGVRWLIAHHWFGDDETAEEQLFSRNTAWFFDPADPANSVMGVFTLFRWGKLNELEARLAIHRMITTYTEREYSILRDGVWLYAMSDLLTGKRDVDACCNPLGLPREEAIRNEISVIITHHFFGRNHDNTVQVMNHIYDPLLVLLQKLNDDEISEERVRTRIARLLRFY